MGPLVQVLLIYLRLLTIKTSKISSASWSGGSRLLWFFINHGGKVNGEVDGPEYYVSLIPNRGLEILINTEFRIASDKVPLIERLKEIIDKNYNVPRNWLGI